jgi:hypothetical protein
VLSCHWFYGVSSALQPDKKMKTLRTPLFTAG